MTGVQAVLLVAFNLAAVALATWAAISSARSAKRSAEAAEQSDEFTRQRAARADSEAEPHLLFCPVIGSMTLPNPNEMRFQAAIVNRSSRSNVLLRFYAMREDSGEQVMLTYAATKKEAERLPFPMVIGPYEAIGLPTAVLEAPDVKGLAEKLCIIIHDMDNKRYSFPLWHFLKGELGPPAQPVIGPGRLPA